MQLVIWVSNPYFDEKYSTQPPRPASRPAASRVLKNGGENRLDSKAVVPGITSVCGVCVGVRFGSRCGWRWGGGVGGVWVCVGWCGGGVGGRGVYCVVLCSVLMCSVVCCVLVWCGVCSGGGVVWVWVVRECGGIVWGESV